VSSRCSPHPTGLTRQLGPWLQAPPRLRPLGPSWPFLALWGASGRSLGRAKLCAKPGEGLAWARHRKRRAAANKTSSLALSIAALDEIRNVMYVLSLFLSFDLVAGTQAGWSLWVAIARCCPTPFFRGSGPGPGLGLAQLPPIPEAAAKNGRVTQIHPYKYHTPSHTPVSCITLIRDRPQHSIQHGVCFCLREARPICRGGLGHTTADPPFVGAALLMRVSGTVFYSATRHGRVSAPSRAPSSETSRLSRYVQHCLFHPSSPSSLA